MRGEALVNNIVPVIVLSVSSGITRQVAGDETLISGTMVAVSVNTGDFDLNNQKKGTINLRICLSAFSIPNASQKLNSNSSKFLGHCYKHEDENYTFKISVA